MAQNSVRVLPSHDAARFLATDRLVWFNEEFSASVEEQLLGLPEDQRFAAEVEGADAATYAGVYSVFPMAVGVPGAPDAVRQVPCAGLTFVGVHPDHRRQGVLTAMVRHHLEAVHEEPGVHVSALHASEPGIYGRYGYGLASIAHEVVLGRGTTLTAPHLDEEASGLHTSMLPVSDPDAPARMRECHRRTAEVGTVVGAPDYYARVCRMFPEELRDKEPWQLLLARRGETDEGFAMFRRSHKWERGRPNGELFVWSLVGTPAARLSLLRRLVDFDLTGRVKLRAAGVEDPVLLWAGGPRGTAGVTSYDNLWVRLVDVPEALQARAWAAPCDVTVQVQDVHAPWNDGTWRLVVGDSGEAAVERTSAEPDLVVPVSALGGAHLGGGNLAAMSRAGLLAQRRPGAAAELWRAMRTDVAPTAAWMF